VNFSKGPKPTRTVNACTLPPGLGPAPEPAAQDPTLNFSKGPKPENKGRTGGFACLERAREAERIGPCRPCSSTAPPGHRLAPEPTAQDPTLNFSKGPKHEKKVAHALSPVLSRPSSLSFHCTEHCLTIERLMKISDIRATTVTVPLEAPLRHANGCHWGRFVRTIVEVETDNGIIGLGEMGGGGESAEATFRAMKSYLVGHDPARLEEMRFLIANPTASLYNNRTQVLAALEFACLDILGQAWGVPVCDILGGRLRDRVPFAAYCFFRYPNPATGEGEVRTIDQLVNNARELKRRFGFTSHKLKAGVFPQDYELEAYKALAASLPGDRFRFDPNGVWSTEQAIRFGQAIEGIRNDYLEDPVYGLHGMRRTREMIRVPLATNTVVVNFEQLAANILNTAVDVILLDTTFWGGIRPCVKAAAVCETFQIGVAVHSSGELGIQLATMLHLGAVIPNLSFAADAHYHHLTDDIIEGGMMRYENGAIRVPTGPGLGVKLNREKLLQYSDLYKRLGSYPYDQDPARPGWTPILPNERWADPNDRRFVRVPY
jgi:glucarate dehydratase